MSLLGGRAAHALPLLVDLRSVQLASDTQDITIESALECDRDAAVLLELLNRGAKAVSESLLRRYQRHVAARSARSSVLVSRTVEIIAIFVVLVGGFTLLAVRRSWMDRRDAELTEASGGEWRHRLELPLDAGPPYADFGAELLLAGPSDVMEGTDEGFEVSYFTTYEGGRSNSRTEQPGAIVQLPVETPKFRFVAADLDERAPQALQALRIETPPHYDNGRPGRVGAATAELLSGARSVIVTTAPFAVWVQSRGAQSREVNRLAIALAKALVSDIRS